VQNAVKRSVLNKVAQNRAFVATAFIAFIAPGKAASRKIHNTFLYKRVTTGKNYSLRMLLGLPN
jgi:hypothetical protein